MGFMGTLSVSPRSSHGPVIITPLMHLTALRPSIRLMGREGAAAVLPRALLLSSLCPLAYSQDGVITQPERLLIASSACRIRLQGRFYSRVVAQAADSLPAPAISPLWAVTRSSAGFGAWRWMGENVPNKLAERDFYRKGRGRLK